MTPRIVVALKTVGNDVVQTRRFRVRRTIATVRACVDRLAPWQVDELLLLSVDGPPSPALIADCAGRSDAPLTIGGGIRRLDEIERALDAGADRCVLTTIALIDPPFVERAVERFGAHRIVVGIDAGWRPDGSVQAMAHGGRTPGGVHPETVARRLTELGAGEILLQSVDRDGSGIGFDLGLTQQVARAIAHPVTALGGAGTGAHVREVLELGGAGHAAAMDLFVHSDAAYEQARDQCARAGLAVRRAPATSDPRERPTTGLRAGLERQLRAATAPLPRQTRRPAPAAWCDCCVTRLPEGSDSRRCRRCDTPGTVPTVEWTHRAELLQRLFHESRASGEHDCVVPVTTADDTAHMVTRLVDDWGHRPLLVAYDAALVGTGGGVLGQRLHERLNTDLVVSAPAPEAARLLAMLGFLAWGDPAWHQRVGTAATATRVAVQRGIPLVVWGTRAGLDLSADRGIGVLPEVTRLHHLAEDGRGHDWTAFLGQHGLTAADLSVVRHPSRADIAAAGVRAISLPGLVPWCPPRSGIADATMDAADAWMDLVRTGSAGLEGRLSDAIRAGRIDRGEAIVRIREHADALPRAVDAWCAAAGVSPREFQRVADLHRDARVWWRVDGRWAADHVWDRDAMPLHLAA